MRSPRHLLFCLVVFSFASAALLVAASAQSGSQLFDQRRYLPPPAATPEERHALAPSEPIPRGWIIAGACAAAAIVLVLLYRSARAWHSSSLFDREYRFPKVNTAAFRFGGKRSGGRMATIRFGPPVPD